MMYWKGFGKKQSRPNLRHYPGLFLEIMWKITKNINQDSSHPWRDSNRAPPEHKSESLPPKPPCSVGGVKWG
jgi:hypothetical protein